MRRDRNRRGSAKPGRGTDERNRKPTRTPVSPDLAVLNVLRKAGRPLRLEDVTAAFGPAGAAQAEHQLAALLKRG
ncbi:MAG TPA: hypothetical protein VFI92_15975, partial [Steroidobacteraceae bacterium]|nr:hypothetical protein [Steroidobacteraceae bacterium]